MTKQLEAARDALKRLKAKADNDCYEFNEVYSADLEQNMADYETIRAALAPVDLDAGLRALDYQRDLSLIFMVAKGSKDYDETIGDRIERVQELILQLKKQNDYLAARGCFVPEGYALVPIEPTDKILNAMAEQCDGYNENYYFDIYKAMIKAAQKKEGE